MASLGPRFRRPSRAAAASRSRFSSSSRRALIMLMFLTFITSCHTHGPSASPVDDAVTLDAVIGGVCHKRACLVSRAQCPAAAVARHRQCRADRCCVRHSLRSRAAPRANRRCPRQRCCPEHLCLVRHVRRVGISPPSSTSQPLDASTTVTGARRARTYRASSSRSVNWSRRSMPFAAPKTMCHPETRQCCGGCYVSGAKCPIRCA
jgi:hypothetical protein